MIVSWRSYFSNGYIFGMEPTIKYTYMTWIPFQFHRIHDFNADFIHLQGVVLGLHKMDRTEERAGASSRRYVAHIRSVYSYTYDHADMLGYLLCKESLSFIVNSFFHPKPSPADADRYYHYEATSSYTHSNLSLI